MFLDHYMLKCHRLYLLLHVILLQSSMYIFASYLALTQEPMSDVFFLAFEKALDFFSSPNKINLFCHTGVRLLAVEAEVRLRCAAVLNA